MIVLAVVAHPDDIEIYMSGTLIRMKKAGVEIHMWNLANGCCGTTTQSKEQIIPIRQAEAQRSADLLGATLHRPLVDDMEILYQASLIQKVAAVVREIRPNILLVPSPDDYMEDHSNTARLAVTAAFARGMPNYATEPHVAPWYEPVAIYHTQPRANHTNMRQLVRPQRYVEITSELERKKEMVACHVSQNAWLDQSQGISSLLYDVEERARYLGQLCGKFEFAEGWRQHDTGGFSSDDYDPMGDLLVTRFWDDPAFR